MSVGGRLIEMRPYTLRDPDKPEFSRDVMRLWVVDRDGTETIVYARIQDDLPLLGDNIWWQGQKIYFDGDRKHMEKIGFSRSPP